MATTTTQIPSSGQIYENIQKELAAALALSSQLQNQISFLTSEVEMFQNQLKLTNTDYLYVKGLEKQINTLHQGFSTYLTVISTRPKVLTAVEQQVAAAEDLLVTVYGQVQIVAQDIYQAMTNLNQVILAIDATQEILANYNANNNPLNAAGNPTVLPPSSSLAPALSTAMNAGLTALQDLSNIFLQFISFMLVIKGLIGSTTYLSNGFTDQINILETLQSHLNYRYRNDIRNEAELKRSLLNSQTKLSFTKERYAATQMDINLLQTESAAAISSTQSGSTASTPALTS